MSSTNPDQGPPPADMGEDTPGTPEEPGNQIRTDTWEEKKARLQQELQESTTFRMNISDNIAKLQERSEGLPTQMH